MAEIHPDVARAKVKAEGGFVEREKGYSLVTSAKSDIAEAESSEAKADASYWIAAEKLYLANTEHGISYAEMGRVLGKSDKTVGEMCRVWEKWEIRTAVRMGPKPTFWTALREMSTNGGRETAAGSLRYFLNTASPEQAGEAMATVLRTRSEALRGFAANVTREDLPIVQELSKQLDRATELIRRETTESTTVSTPAEKEAIFLTDIYRAIGKVEWLIDNLPTKLSEEARVALLRNVESRILAAIDRKRA